MPMPVLLRNAFSQDDLQLGFFKPLFVQTGQPFNYFRVCFGEIFCFGYVFDHVAQEVFDLGDISAFVIRCRAVVDEFPVALTDCPVLAGLPVEYFVLRGRIGRIYDRFDTLAVDIDFRWLDAAVLCNSWHPVDARGHLVSDGILTDAAGP